MLRQPAAVSSAKVSAGDGSAPKARPAAAAPATVEPTRHAPAARCDGASGRNQVQTISRLRLAMRLLARATR